MSSCAEKRIGVFFPTKGLQLNYMENRVLVAYASRYGATTEIAKKIGEVLKKAGLKVEVSPAKNVMNPAEYRAVILGTALYIGKWRKEAEEFLLHNENTLADKLVWIFSSGPTGEGDPEALIEGKGVPETLQSAVDHIKPRDIAVFHGYVNPEKINFLEKWVLTKIVKKPIGDFRDWEAISSWAGSIAGFLKKK